MLTRIVLTVLLLVVGAVSALTPLPERKAGAVTGFLTLPFPSHPDMRIQQAWTYTGGGSHGGIDYVKGTLDVGNSWTTFPVLASAAGEAEWVDSPVNGKYVFIHHLINGVRYYTYYGHLSSVAAGIPLRGNGSKKTVAQGEFIGNAGNTGTSSNGWLHLHFALKNASDTAIDPYGLGVRRGPYPQPNAVGGSCGQNSYWISCPPPYFGPNCTTPNPGPNQVVLFEHPNYGGRCVLKNAGEYANPALLGFPDDMVSSLKLGDGASIGLYDRPEYITPRGFWYGPIDVSQIGTSDNKTSSVRVGHNALVVTAVRAGTSTRLIHACWIAAKNGDFQTYSVFGQCDAWRNPVADGVTPFGASARGLKGFEPGNYTLRQFATPAGYSKPSDRPIVIVEGQTTRITVPHNPLLARGVPVDGEDATCVADPGRIDPRLTADDGEQQRGDLRPEELPASALAAEDSAAGCRDADDASDKAKHEKDKKRDGAKKNNKHDGKRGHGKDGKHDGKRDRHKSPRPEGSGDRDRNANRTHKHGRR